MSRQACGHTIWRGLFRRMIDLVARFLFAPTEASRRNLLAENADASRVFVTGNTVVDALMCILSRINADRSAMARIEQTFPFLRNGKPLALVTGHRRESHGRGLQNICRALVTLSRRYDFNFVYPVHLNPNVARPVHRLLQGLPNVFLLPPVSYLDFVVLLSRSRIVITDSGGVQEEAASLGKPVLVTRSLTERPEGIEAGLARLVGTSADRIVAAFDDVVSGEHEPDLGCRIYGDGRAAQRIVRILAGPPRRSAKSSVEVSYED